MSAAVAGAVSAGPRSSAPASQEKRPQRPLPGCDHLSDREWLALCRKRSVHPLTGRRLRPGQRVPSDADADAALQARLREPEPKPCPRWWRPGWRICEARCQVWQRHLFAAECGDTRHFRSGVDLSGDEFALFLWDLRCWVDLCRKAAQGRCAHPGPLHAYLLPGREDWGILAVARDWDLKEEMLQRWLAREDAPEDEEDDWDDVWERDVAPLAEDF